MQQSAAKTATVTGTVVQNNGTPIAGADIFLTGQGAQLRTKSDARGTFAFTSVPFGTYLILINAAALGQATRPNLAVSSDINVAIQYAPKSNASGLKTIADVTTHSAGTHINVTAASIASINPSDYAFQGNTSWKELLDRVPGVVAGGGLNSGFSQNNTIPDGPFQPVVLSINGALPYETSTTLDGMPVVNTSLASSPGDGADLAFFPMPMFDTADVVRGPGANAPSIVGSIGGSFVLHPPGRVNKNQFNSSFSFDPYGGAVWNAKAALRFGKLSTIIVYGSNTSPGPLGSQTIVSSFAVTPATVNGQAFSRGGFVGFVTPPGYQFCICKVQDTLLYYGVPVDTSWKQHSGAIALSYDFTPAVSAQIFYAGSSSAMPLPAPIVPVNFTPGAGYSGSISPGAQNFILASGGPAQQAQASSLFEEKLTASIGGGVLRLAALQDNSFDHQFNPDSQPNGSYTLYGTGFFTSAPNTPVNFNGTQAFLTFTPQVSTTQNSSNNRDILASYAMQLGTKSSVDISYVASYYNSPFFSIGTFGNFPPFVTIQPSGVSSTNREMRAHIATEVSSKLSLDASWYNTRATFHVQNPADATGNSYVDSVFRYSAPRLGAVWRPNNNVAIRGAAGGGYTLPPLHYLTPGTSVTTPVCILGTCTLTLPNLNLTPEKSFGFDVGVDVRLHHDTVLSLDAYRTNLFGQFFQSTSTGTFLGQPLFTTQFQNLSQSRYEGINFDIRHDVPKGIYWRGALGLTRGYVVSVPAGFYNGVTGFPAQACTNCQNLYVVPGINFDGKFQSTVPYANGTAQIGYRWPAGTYVEISPTYYGKNNPYFEPAFIELDANAGFQLTKRLSLLVTFSNITGIYDQNYQAIAPTLGAPTIAGPPFALLGIPYGPRTARVTANFSL